MRLLDRAPIRRPNPMFLPKRRPSRSLSRRPRALACFERGVAVAIALASCASLRAYRAQAAPTTATAEDAGAALVLFKSGLDLRAQGDFAGALEKFKAAHAAV